MVTSADAARSESPAFSGWGLTLCLFAALVIGSLALFAAFGVGEAGVRVWIRATARASVTLFLLAFTARPLRLFVRGDVTRWLLANRRYLGVSAALAHFLHGIALVWLHQAFPGVERPDLTTLIGGGLGFAFYFAMGLTSNDAAVAALGKRGWKLLHTLGAYWVWFIFTLTNWGNVPLAFETLGIGHQLLYSAMELALVAALGLRIAARFAQRKRAASSS
jgi:DMSO/TMAO reductase YedYZ heme-binding membrane subunit